jgi:hypothetical protein
MKMHSKHDLTCSARAFFLRSQLPKVRLMTGDLCWSLSPSEARRLALELAAAVETIEAARALDDADGGQS